MKSQAPCSQIAEVPHTDCTSFIVEWNNLWWCYWSVKAEVGLPCMHVKYATLELVHSNHEASSRILCHYHLLRSELPYLGGTGRNILLLLRPILVLVMTYWGFKVGCPTVDAYTQTTVFCALIVVIRAPSKPETCLNLLDDCLTDAVLCGIWILESTASTKEIKNLTHA